MPQADYLGSARPRLILYLPHRPNELEQLIIAPNTQALIEANSNHWRKIVNLLAKIACPVADDWRKFRDETLFQHIALCFTPRQVAADSWHWVGGKDNLERFTDLNHGARTLADCDDVAIDPEKRLLLTPYPDYRQLSNVLVSKIRRELGSQGFYELS